jgi:hypothetical protein
LAQANLRLTFHLEFLYILIIPHLNRPVSVGLSLLATGTILTHGVFYFEKEKKIFFS